MFAVFQRSIPKRVRVTSVASFEVVYCLHLFLAVNEADQSDDRRTRRGLSVKNMPRRQLLIGVLSDGCDVRSLLKRTVLPVGHECHRLRIFEDVGHRRIQITSRDDVRHVREVLAPR